MITNNSKAPSCTCPSGDGSLVHPCPAHPASVKQAGGDERAAFEAWATHLPMDRQYLRPDLYMPPTQWAWDAWQARAALVQPSPAPTLRAAIDVANDRFEVPVAKWGTDLAGEKAVRAALSGAQAQHSAGYAGARQCVNCRHIGINDSADYAACHDCNWTGPEPDEDKCPGCAGENCMAAACPECGGRYDLVAEANITAPAGQVPQAWLDVQAERRRQIEAEGWTPEHDDEHSHGQMARAAACYALAGSSAPNDGTAALLVSLAWPWDEQWWKPSTARRDMVKACALGLAEIERLDRVAASQGGPSDA
ncbi:TPA: hypothetical protein ACQSOC_002202 [Pseudomonas aeruginosa]|uniref:hypothetical protein n=1 Tax=Pseudomonas aeruginosa TaxID=287 RepID=UPI0021C56918|nr:hypothetical protein [Pseudomonas aeruginosa]MDI4119377.1 hypothetical protein [Pseudomonas aeruginosa]